MKKLATLYRIIVITFVIIFTNQLAISQDFPPWDVPESVKNVMNPVKPEKASLEAGKTLFMLQCKACHGEKGRGDGVIRAANLVSDNFALESDGAIFWKLQQGRGQMPSFKALPEEQLWNVINFVRSLKVKREVIAKRNALVNLLTAKRDSLNEVKVKVVEVLANNQQVPVENIRVDFFAKRYFGKLPFAGDTPHVTDKNGETSAFCPDDIIGDEKGDLTIIAAIDDMDFNPAEAQQTVAWGVVNPKDYWSERRALWKNNDHVPMWLLITFWGGAITVWSFIGYVVLLVVKIKFSEVKN